MATGPGYEYIGSELAIFAEAANWKAYLSRQLRPYLGADVLEIGAGIGATTSLLCSPDQRKWVALEPDGSLAAQASSRFAADRTLGACEVRVGTLDAVRSSELFDSILYIDVLEHIEDDVREVARAASHLKPGGYLAVLAPAHQSLFSPFDAAIGHFRRYSAGTLKAVGPSGLTLTRLRYLDSVGLFASAANRLVLRQSMPTPAQIRAWDRMMVPLSRWIDPLLGFSAGKSVLAVWRR